MPDGELIFVIEAVAAQTLDPNSKISRNQRPRLAYNGDVKPCLPQFYRVIYIPPLLRLVVTVIAKCTRRTHDLSRRGFNRYAIGF